MTWASLKFSVTRPQYDRFPLKEVCLKAGSGLDLLMSLGDGSGNIDCMGKKVSLREFCLSKMSAAIAGKENLKGLTNIQANKVGKMNASTRKFLRAYGDKSMGDVVCQSGESAILKIKCRERLCLDSKLSCIELKKNYAYSLGIVHHSVTGHGDENSLNCYFGR